MMVIKFNDLNLNNAIINQYIEKKSAGNPFLLSRGIRTFTCVFIGLAFLVNTFFNS